MKKNKNQLLDGRCETKWCEANQPTAQKKKEIFKNLQNLKYKKYLIWPIKYIKHYKSTEYMKSTILSINMIGNEKQKTWQKNTIFRVKC